MYEFIKPNYKDNNIVNLMSSISNSFWKKHEYNTLKSLGSEELDSFENIVLIVVDWLGYNYLKRQENSFLLKNLDSKLTSTFLSTTPCANTVFQTGYPPQQHGLTGWTANIKEVGGITRILPFTSISGEETLSNTGFNINKIMDIDSLHNGFNWKCFTIIEEKKSKRDFIKYVAKETKIIAAKTYKDIFIELKELIKSKSKERRFIHAYMDEFDSIQHFNGVNCDKTNLLFKDIDREIQALAESAKGTNTKLIVVSDHGMIDHTKESQLWLKDIPGLEECLTIPITGEPRVVDCFVRPRKVKDFKKIMETTMSKYCWYFPWEQLINDNFYGLGEVNKKLFDRVGDYVLIMKDNYVLRDTLEAYVWEVIPQKAAHWACSDDEMLVPLVIIDCN